ELDYRDRKRIFNLGYYTWVEQQGIELAEFDRRKDQQFWHGLLDVLPVWDRLIGEMNAASGAKLAA
ncbi:MAG: pyridoxal-5'-phosphate-dependent protein subunit beta, partial [Alphaproteobacteria bacterium]|nr:pyridoxal-5'-phosphate-dependent protein subunit beta [Alphaproteobacteria bacterium]